LQSRSLNSRPSQTWEGFIGALFLTTIFAVLLTQILLSFGTYFICKQVWPKPYSIPNPKPLLISKVSLQPELTLWRPNLEKNCMPSETTYPYYLYDKDHPLPAIIRNVPFPSWYHRRFSRHNYP
jgi:hypothetical protein